MALEAVVTVLVDKLADLGIREATFLHGVEDKIKWVETELRQIQCFLQDADAKQHTNSNVKNWLHNFRDVAFDAEDVFDTFIFMKTLQERRNFIMRYAFFFNNLHTCREIGLEIERIVSKIKQISYHRSAYGIVEAASTGTGGGIGEVSRPRWSAHRRISPLDGDEPDQVVGLENDVNSVKARLIAVGDESPRRCVISIVGMGGQGKTTLATKVYNCDAVKRHFDLRAWVSVSQVYNTKDLLQDIAKMSMGLKTEDSQKMKEDELKQTIKEFLKNQRYLVAMDDVWDFDVWNNLHVVFPDTNNGSRIIFTTRKMEVARHADTKSPPHELKRLSEDDSWALFTTKVALTEENITLTTNNHHLLEKLEEIGKNIVEKCRGLPLAIIVLGGLLSRKRKSISEWSTVLNSLSWQLNQDETPCSQILALSYHDLPSYLKPCFLYLGIFPEDYEISASQLMKLWISEGFVQQRSNEIAEDVAEVYLNDLVDRCMVQVTTIKPTGSIKKCRIHDLLRDLAIEKAKEVKLFHVHSTGNKNSSSSSSASSLNKVRRLAVHTTTIDRNIFVEHSYRHIRSVFYFEEWDEQFLCGIIRGNAHFGMLRVLHLSVSSYYNKKALPKAVGKLIHLRYLKLKGYIRVKMFSSTIGNLRNLQILDLKWTNVTCGRDAILKMNCLRHLSLNSISALNPPRSRNGSSSHSSIITNLQTLCGLEIDRNSLVKDGWDQYNNLRKLGLRLQGDLLESQVGALAGWIAKLDRLESLRLSFHGKERFSNPIQRLNIFSTNHFNLYKLYLGGDALIEKLPDPCEFPSNNFSHLTLEFCVIGEEMLPTLGKLPNLKFLMLIDCTLKVKDINFISGRFPRLQVLKLFSLYDFEELKVEEGALPCLRDLYISHCQHLKEIPDGLPHVTSLQRLNLAMPCQFIERVRRNEGQDWDKVSHIPTVEAAEAYTATRDESEENESVTINSIQMTCSR